MILEARGHMLQDQEEDEDEERAGAGAETLLVAARRCSPQLVPLPWTSFMNHHIHVTYMYSHKQSYMYGFVPFGAAEPARSSIRKLRRASLRKCLAAASYSIIQPP